MNLVANIEQHIVSEQLFRRGDCLVVAVSGGPDSAALLHILFALSEKWSWKLVVAHLNHQFRGEESSQEADFVERWANELNLPCEIGHVNVPEYIQQTGMNTQAAAREKRYEFLHQVADKYAANCIVLAHHADDQAETILMRFIQGTGPSGLCGMPVRRIEKKVELIRPLIRIYKSEIISYCEINQIAYRIDSSNLERKYIRNRIRLELIPELKQYNPLFPQSLNRLAETMRGEDDYLAQETRRKFEEITSVDQRGYHFARADFAGLHLALQRRMIKLILSYLSCNQQHMDFTAIERVRSAILRTHSSNFTMELAEGARISLEYDRVRVHSDEPRAEEYEYEVSGLTGEITIAGSGLSVVFRHILIDEMAEGRDGLLSARLGTNQAVFDLDQLHLPLRLRNRKPGDRMDVLGLNGSKKVKDIFIDCKISPGLRNWIPLVVDADDRIIWIAGVRRSAHAPVTSRTRRLLHAEIINNAL